MQKQIQMHIVETENKIIKRKCSAHRFNSNLVVEEQNLGKLKDVRKHLDRSTYKKLIQIGKK